ncbi:MAG: hypothetical protein IKC49_02305 [Clostridia bacterium]|nr:hypothetical protein [Clostridia bacterium]
MAKAGSIQRKMKRSTGIGPFICGSLFGFLLCIGALVGLGFFVYYNVSIEWINSTFNTNIETNNKEIEDKTINDIVKVGINLVNSLDTYTLTNLKNDFGVELPDEIKGIDISDLKTVPLQDLPSALMDRIGSISADELGSTGMIDLSSLDFIFSKTNTYYYNEGKIYRDSGFTNFVRNVKFDNGNIQIADYTDTVESDNSVVVPFKYLPLDMALDDFTSMAGDKLTIGELETSFGVDLPSYLDNVDKSYTINQLENAISGLYLGDFLGYEYDSSTGKYYTLDNDSNRVELSGVANVVAYIKIGEVGDRITSLTVGDVFGESANSGILSLIGTGTLIEDIPNELDDILDNTTIGELHAQNVIEITDYDENKTLSGTDIKISELTIQQLIEKLFTL